MAQSHLLITQMAPGRNSISVLPTVKRFVGPSLFVVKQINFLVDISLRQSIYDIYDRQMARANQCVVNFLLGSSSSFRILVKRQTSFALRTVCQDNGALALVTSPNSHLPRYGKRVVLKN